LLSNFDSAIQLYLTPFFSNPIQFLHYRST